MSRMKILNTLEQEAFDSPPNFNSWERKRFFDFPSGILKVANTLKTPTNIVCFLAATGYFKATKKFFGSKFHKIDLLYIAKKHQISFDGVLPNTYFKQTASRHRYLILDFYGFKEFDLLTECIIREEITRLIRARLKPKLIFFRVVDNLIQQRVAVLSYDFLSKMILEEIRNYKLNVISLLQQELSIEQRAKLDDLLEKSPADVSSLPTLNHRYRGSKPETAECPNSFLGQGMGHLRMNCSRNPAIESRN